MQRNIMMVLEIGMLGEKRAPITLWKKPVQDRLLFIFTNTSASALP